MKKAPASPSPRQSCPDTVYDESSALAFLKVNYRQVKDVCGVSRQAVLQWARVPAEQMPRLNLAFGIPWHIMRPDLFQMKDCQNGQEVRQPKHHHRGKGRAIHQED
jgi:hypothetical protein